MQQRFQYVSVDTILSKYLRDFRGVELNEDVAKANPYNGTRLHLEMTQHPIH